MRFSRISNTYKSIVHPSNYIWYYIHRRKCLYFFLIPTIFPLVPLLYIFLFVPLSFVIFPSSHTRLDPIKQANIICTVYKKKTRMASITIAAALFRINNETRSKEYNSTERYSARVSTQNRDKNKFLVFWLFVGCSHLYVFVCCYLRPVPRGLWNLLFYFWTVINT